MKAVSEIAQRPLESRKKKKRMKIFAIGDLHLALDPRLEKPMDIFGGGLDRSHRKTVSELERNGDSR